MNAYSGYYSRKKNIIYSSLFILILGVLLTSCESSVAKEQLTTNDFETVTKTGKFEILIPKYMEPAKINPSADIQYIELNKKILVLVLSSPKNKTIEALYQYNSDIKSNELLDEVTHGYIQYTKSMLPETTVGAIEHTKIGDLNATQVEMIAQSPIANEKAKMFITHLEGKSYFFSIICLGTASKYSTYTNTFHQIVDSFREL